MNLALVDFSLAVQEKHSFTIVFKLDIQLLICFTLMLRISQIDKFSCYNYIGSYLGC